MKFVIVFREKSLPHMIVAFITPVKQLKNDFILERNQLKKDFILKRIGRKGTYF